MKKIISTLAAIVLAISVFAQDRVTFKGFTIGGTAKEFIKKMKANGYEFKSREVGLVSFKGDFAGYSDCDIFAKCDRNSFVYAVVVVFPAQDSRDNLLMEYNFLLSCLKEKYGQPIAGAGLSEKDIYGGLSLGEGEVSCRVDFSIPGGYAHIAFVRIYESPSVGIFYDSNAFQAKKRDAVNDL